MILGLGVDLVPLARLKAARRRRGFDARVFTAAERAYARRHADAAERLAGRFAAKEAVMKALGTGWAGGVAWKGIEILGNGAPRVKLTGKAARRASVLGIRRWHLSMSHDGGYAVAVAVAEL